MLEYQVTDGPASTEDDSPKVPRKIASSDKRVFHDDLENIDDGLEIDLFTGRRRSIPKILPTRKYWKFFGRTNFFVSLCKVVKPPLSPASS